MAEPILEKMLDYFMHPRNAWLYGQDIHRALTEFTGPGQLPEDAFDFFVDWFAFDFEFRPSINLVSYAAKENPMKFSRPDQTAIAEMQNNRLDFFEVLSS